MLIMHKHGLVSETTPFKHMFEVRCDETGIFLETPNFAIDVDKDTWEEILRQYYASMKALLNGKEARL